MLPLPLQNAAISCYGLYWKWRRFGGLFEEELRAFRERENYTAAQWRAYQTVQLRRLLVHAFETVPFYREKYRKHGFTIDQLNRFELEDLPRLPYLTKQELRKFGTTTLLSTRRARNGQFYSSSGSTGTPTKIYYSIPFHQRWSAAIEARVRHWAGVNRFLPRGMIGGRRIIKSAIAPPPYYRYNIFEKQVYFSAYHIAPSTVLNYLEGIKKYKLAYMTGYAMSNFFLASLIKESALSAPPLQAVITSSECLTPDMRRVFFEVYGCKTFDSYSGVEACGLISETPQGELLISPDVGIMEVVRSDGKPARPGEGGEVVSTGFLNYDQPLIRYRIGDMVTLCKSQSTQCGRAMPVIEKIDGRVEDVVIGKDGRRMVRFHSIFVDLSGVIAAQIVQEDYDSFTINIVADEQYEQQANEAAMIARLESQLGPLKVDFQYMEELPKNANGKFQAVISKVRN